MSAERYIGRIVSVPGTDGFAFIGIGSVTREDGSAHGLETEGDIFLHQDECAAPLKVGLKVSFEVTPDRTRGEGNYRAVGAVEFFESQDLLPAGEPAIPGFAIMVPPVQSKAELALTRRLPIHAKMKVVDAATVSQVAENLPMQGVPRVDSIPDDEQSKRQLMRWFLATLFPHLESFGTDFNILDYTDEDLDRLVAESVENYRAMGLTQEIEVLEAEVKLFKEMRAVLALMIEENLVRQDAVIPIGYLPDLFMAVPVWYYWVDAAQQREIAPSWESDDPKSHSAVEYFCGLFPSQRWCDTFQLFNRRVRTLQQYKGEVIPPHVARRMRRAIELFDYVVIATPYHDEAGKDWEDLEWLRSIDPYVIGFKKGIPFFFVLARFSDSGTFPLYNELVADAIEFLRKNKQRLQGFNRIGQPFWCHADENKLSGQDPFGDYLMRHVDQLLAAFEAGNLFEWLRGDKAANG